MDQFPLSQIPYASLIGIIGKMTFLQATRMRQTCRQIDRLADGSAGKLCHLVTQDIDLLVGIGALPEGMDLQLTLAKYEYHVIDERASRGHRMIIGSSCGLLPRNLEFARFKTLSVLVTASRLDNYNYSVNAEFLSVFKEINTKCKRLTYTTFRDCDDVDLITMVRLFCPQFVHYKKANLSHGLPGQLVPLSFNMLRGLPSLGVKQIYIDICECLPSDYARLLSKYEQVVVEQIVADTTLLLFSLIKVVLTDPNSAMNFFRIPIYIQIEKFHTMMEIKECEFTIYEIRRGEGRIFPYYIIDIPSHFIIFTWSCRYITDYCIYRKISKQNVCIAVCYWVEDLLPRIPFDASDLYEHVLMHRNNFEMIRRHLEAIQSLSLTYPIP